MQSRILYWGVYVSDALLQHLLVAKMEENRPGVFYSRLAVVLHLVFDIHLCAEVWTGILQHVIRHLVASLPRCKVHYSQHYGQCCVYFDLQWFTVRRECLMRCG